MEKGTSRVNQTKIDWMLQEAANKMNVQGEKDWSLSS